MSSKFNVMDMAAAISSDNNIDDLFNNKDDNMYNISNEPPTNENKKAEVNNTGTWTPDETLISDMDEFNQTPLTYSKDEFHEDTVEKLKDIGDECIKRDSSNQKDEMTRMVENIEIVKQKYKIKKFQIPPGQMQVMIYNAASDTNNERALEKLNKLFIDIIENHNEFILEWNDPDVKYNINNDESEGNFDATESNECDENKDDEEEYIESNETKVIIDKRQLPNISWSDEDINKIKKSRTIELNIIEEAPIQFSEIDEADNTVDKVISKYIRKNNDIATPLPASRYRCTFRGLSYPEVLDLSNSNEMNTIDGEYKKWTICFEHMENMSIGPWEEYKWYIDNGVKVKVPIKAHIPANIDEKDVHIYTAFEDFLHKTSFLDLDFMLWKILCATCMDSEIVQIDCNHKLNNGRICRNKYDWIYNPSELLDIESILESVLEEMKYTSEVSGMDAIIKNFNESFLRKNRTAKLHDSGILVQFGHVSAYTYLESIYPAIKSLEDKDNDPSIASKGLNYTALTVVKGFLVQKENGRYDRFSNINSMINILENLSEIDWLCIGEIVEMVMQPYRFKYALRNLICPKCKTKDEIKIDNLSSLLFIVARSLSSVQVTFKMN